jgi:hypothetical protein
MNPNRRFSVALHEAGHAIVALKLGFRDIIAELQPRHHDSWAYRGRITAIFFPAGSTPEEIRARTLLRLSVMLAGVRAQEIMDHPCRFPTDGDSDKWRYKLSCEKWSFDTTEQEKAAVLCDEILLSNKAAIVKVAEVLDYKGLLHHREIKRLVVRTPSITQYV